MIKSFTITNYLGDSIKIEMTKPEKSGFIIESVEGLGPVKANVNTTASATHDGSRFNSARAEERNIVFNFIFTETYGGELIENARQRTYKYFPLKREVTILVETDNRTVKTKGYVESNEPDIFSEREGCQISIVCPDPYFYSDDINTTIFYSVEPWFEFPFSNESVSDKLLEMGKINYNTGNVIFYEGDSEIGVIIRIHAVGEVKNLVIHDLGKRETMRIDTDKLATITGSGIIDRDDIIISTLKGDKYITLIREGVEYNILNCLDKGTAWFTLTAGDNLFAFAADEGVTNLQFQIENQIIYEGV